MRCDMTVSVKISEMRTVERQMRKKFDRSGVESMCLCFHNRQAY